MRERLWMDDTAARIEAMKIVTDVVRGMNSASIARLHPDPMDAQKVQKALMTADVHLTWEDSWPPRKDRTAKIVGLAAAPLLVPIIGCLWIVWWMESVRKTALRMWRGLP